MPVQLHFRWSIAQNPCIMWQVLVPRSGLAEVWFRPADKGVYGWQVEAKYPALLFKQQLDAFVQKIFPMLRDNVKKEITPQLAACIHAPRAVTTRSRRGAAPAQAGDSATSPGEPPHPHQVYARARCCAMLSFVAPHELTRCCGPHLCL